MPAGGLRHPCLPACLRLFDTAGPLPFYGTRRLAGRRLQAIAIPFFPLAAMLLAHRLHLVYSNEPCLRLPEGA